MSKAGESLARRFGHHLGESLGLRTNPPPTGGQFPGETRPPGASPDDGRTRAREAGHMEIDRIIPDPDQPRKDFSPDAIGRLASSMRKFGQLQPVRVRWDEGLGKWVIIAGERRYRAAKEAGLRTVACIFVDGPLSPSEVLQEQMVENCLREDLKPTEQARAYRELMQANGWTAKQLSEELHVSESDISKAIKSLDLPEDLRAKVDSGELPKTAAYEVARLESDDERREIAARIMSGEISRDEAAREVRARTRRPAGGGRASKGRGGDGGKAAQGRPRTYRTPDGQVIVKPKRGRAGDPYVAALREALAQAEGAGRGRGEAA